MIVYEYHYEEDKTRGFDNKNSVQSLASLGRMSGVNFIAFAMLPLIFIFP